MVVQMEECDIPNSTRKYNLPYKTYCYARDPEDRSCCLSCHAISFDCVTGRAFVVSCVNTSAFNTVTVANFDSQYYYCIPHNRLLGTSPHNYDYLQGKYPNTFLTPQQINTRDALLNEWF